ncbi:MAG: hypothetical protein ACR2N6_09080 [Miltoncostaeaceae bacterium]
MSTQDQEPPEGREPTPEEMAAAIAYRLARTPVRDVLLQTMATLADMAGIRMGLGPEGDEPKDLEQSRQAIEALRALHGVAEEQLGVAQTRPFREPLAALQLHYARLVEAEGGEGTASEDSGEGGEAPPPEPPPADPAGGPDAASRLWVPPGTRR